LTGKKWKAKKIKPNTETLGFNVKKPSNIKGKIMDTSQPQLSLFLWSVYKNAAIFSSDLQEDYISKS
jgi:hypothetical protein